MAEPAPDAWTCVDVGLLDGVRLRSEVRDREGSVLWRRQMSIPVPEEMMDQLEELLGDGRATVSVGDEMKESVDFTSVGCFVNVKLTCNQDIESVIKASHIARQMVQAFVLHGYEHGWYQMMKFKGENPGEEPPTHVELTLGDDSLFVAGVSAEGRGQKKIKAGGMKGKNMPRFRR